MRLHSSRSKLSIWAIPLALLSAPGCLTKIPKPDSPDRGIPQVSWVIMHGDRDNPDREYACQSNPRDECVIPASKPSERVFSDVHFYYHGVAAGTGFTGTVTVGYLERSGGASGFTVNSIVEKRAGVNYQGIIGIVTATPGSYEVRFDIVAADAGQETHLRDRVVVNVR